MECFDVVIVGAGASGLLTAVKLARAGYHRYVILEKAPSLGGTWRDNTYPGVACDVPSHLYSFSFEPSSEWSRVYSPQSEILTYLDRVTEKYGVLARIRFGQEVTGARFLEQRGGWKVELKDGSEAFGRFLFLGTGGLEKPLYPDIPGLGDFQGEAFHSARWGLGRNLKGKRVAVIGTAASAVQLIPQVAREAAKLSVFQRTPNWILPKHDRAYASWEKAIFRSLPRLQRLYRGYLKTRSDLGFTIFNRRSWLARLVERLALGNMRNAIEDPMTRAALTPHYPIGCKRILLSDDFYPALARPNVELVTAPVASIGPGWLETSDLRRHPVDALIFATGFQVLGSYVPLIGRDGRALSEAWKEAPEAYKGVTVAGFPNLFLLLGPNSALGHSSVWQMSEAQADYAIRAMQELDRRGALALDLRESAMRAYNQQLQQRFGGLVWSAGCSSWYKTPEGKIFTIYPGTVRQYERELAQPDWDQYLRLPRAGTEPTHAE